MNRLVYGVGVDPTSAIPIQLFGDMLDEVGQSRLVVGSYQGARSLSLCLAAHDGHVTLANGLRLVRRTAQIRHQAGVRSGTGLLRVRRRNV
jgi:hypothetical protein